jgi:hypothetical protein
LRGAKRSNIEVVVSKEEEEESYSTYLIQFSASKIVSNRNYIN